MKYALRKKALLVCALLLLLSGCGRVGASGQEEPEPRPGTQADLQTEPGEDGAEFSYEGTVFRYGERSWDLAERVPSATAILSVRPVGDKLLVECHCGPKNGVYCVFDPAGGSFGEEITGNHLIWYGDDLTTAVYSFWSEVRTYDGTVLRDFDLPEEEYIYHLAFSEDRTRVSVTIVKDDGTDRTELIGLPR